MINSLHMQLGQLQAEIYGLKHGDSQSGRKNLTEYKSLDQVPKFNGEEKYFSDFEFKLQHVTPQNKRHGRCKVVRRKTLHTYKLFHT